MYGLPQPAAERGRAEDPPVYLPASKNKKSAYNIYTKTVTQYSPVHYRSFCHIWRRQAAHIKVMKPRTDVCALCNNLRYKIRVARTEEETECSVQALRSHTSLAQEERQYYRDLVDGAQASLDEAEGIVHYTFELPN